MNQTLPLEDTPPAQAASSPPKNLAPEKPYPSTLEAKWARLNAFTKAAYVMTVAFIAGIPTVSLLGFLFLPEEITLESVKAFYILALVFSVAAKDWKPALIATLGGGVLWYICTHISQPFGA